MSDEAKGVLRDQALRLDKSSLTVADECLRFRFEESADLVALMASHGELDYSDVLQLVRGVVSGDRDAEEAAATLDAYVAGLVRQAVTLFRADLGVAAAYLGESAAAEEPV